MKFPSPILPNTGDRIMGLAQGAIEQQVAFVASVPWLDGRLIKGTMDASGVLSDGVALSSTPVTVDHGLGRAWRGCFVVRTYAATPALIAEAATQPSDLTKQIALLATNACVVWLWIW